MTDELVFGVDIKDLDADRIALEWVRKDWMQIELALFGGKWFDYRFLNPVAATYLFAHEYKKAYRAAFSRNIDTERSKFIVPLPDDLFTLPDVEKLSEKKGKQAIAARKITVTGIWRARQVADAMGMPYGIFIERALHWRLRYWQKKYLPRPCHLYADICTDRTATDWEEYQRTRLCYSKLPAFANSAYDPKVKCLNDHREYLLSLIVDRGEAPSVMAQFLDEEILPHEAIQSRFGPQAYQAALALTESSPSQNRYN